MWTLIITIITAAGSPAVSQVTGFESEGLCANAGAGYVREMRLAAADLKVAALCVSTRR